jgi:hypothetical protein
MHRLFSDICLRTDEEKSSGEQEKEAQKSHRAVSTPLFVAFCLKTIKSFFRKEKRPRNPTVFFDAVFVVLYKKNIKTFLVCIDIDTHPNMNNSATSVNEINTRAVLLMQQSKHKEAIRCLRNGIRFLLAHHVNGTAHSNDRAPPGPPTYEAQQQNIQTHHYVTSMDIESNERPKYSVTRLPGAQDTASVSPNNVFVIFDRAFTFSEEFRELKSRAESSKASATLLYNMGMALHLVGVQENNTAVLEKSLRAYQMAYSVLLGEDCDEDCCSLLVMLALINNMSHIHYALSNFKEARRCRDLIPQVFACSSPFGSSEAAGDDYVFFVLEAMMFCEGRELDCAPVA